MKDLIYYRAITKNDIDVKVMGIKIPKGTEFLVLINDWAYFDPDKKRDGYFSCKNLGINSIWHDEFELVDNIPMSCSLCKNHWNSRCKDCRGDICNIFEPYPPAMTAEEFNILEAEVLKDLPEEFRSRISYMAHERGHSAGYEECLIHVKEYVRDLKDPIEKFKNRISQSRG